MLIRESGLGTPGNDLVRVLRVLRAARQMYHLAGQSHVGLSYDIPESTCELTAMCTLRAAA